MTVETARTDLFAERRQFWPLLALLALCLIGVVFGRMQSTATGDGKTDLLSRGVRATVEPLSRVFTSVANGTSDFFGGIFSAAELTRQNRELKQLQTVRTYVVFLRTLQGC